MPTRAVVIPGVERTNCMARSASDFIPNALVTKEGRPRESCPWSIAALATSVMPSLDAAATTGAGAPSSA